MLRTVVGGRRRPSQASRGHAPRRPRRGRLCRDRRPADLGRGAHGRRSARGDGGRAARRRQGRRRARGRRRRRPGRALAREPRRLGPQLRDGDRQADADRRRLPRRAGDDDRDGLRAHDRAREVGQDPGSGEPSCCRSRSRRRSPSAWSSTRQTLFVNRALAEHRNPVAGGGYLFPGKRADLPDGWYWTDGQSHVTGSNHRSSSSQRFAYDFVVRRWDGKQWTSRKAGASGNRNENSLIWGLPVYAMADGWILRCGRSQADNVPGREDQRGRELPPHRPCDRRGRAVRRTCARTRSRPRCARSPAVNAPRRRRFA